MPQVGLEPTTPVFERAKTVHTLDRGATVIGAYNLSRILYEIYPCWEECKCYRIQMDD
jgi:hypothetical protein